MKLTQFLRNQGYDLIEGPVRNHKPLQLWLKQIFNKIELYYANINQAFTSNVVLEEIENPALTVTSNHKNEYNFNIGMTVLDEILKSQGFTNFEIASKITTGKSVVISYSDSVTKEVPVGILENYLSNADFVHPNPALLRNANQDNIIVITGVVYAKNLIVEIETDFNVNADLMADLFKIFNGKLDFSILNQNTVKMTSNGANLFPIAIKANRINFDKSVFNKLILVSDNRNFF